MLLIRSALFALAQVALTPLFALAALATFPFAPLRRYRVISWYARIIVWLARALCGIRYRVIGAENIPAEPCVILSKHQSAWETFAFQVIFPPQVWVLKRELLWVPFFGWGLAMTRPIAIDRAAARHALKQIVDQGADRLASGFCVIIFPEGTRVAPGEKRKYRPGGAWLAVHTGAAVLPVAHNASYCWGKGAFIKRPGIITVCIGKPIDPKSLTADELNHRVEEWIETRMAEISGETP